MEFFVTPPAIFMKNRVSDLDHILVIVVVMDFFPVHYAFLMLVEKPRNFFRCPVVTLQLTRTDERENGSSYFCFFRKKI